MGHEKGLSETLVFVLWFRLILKGLRGSRPDLRIWQFHENTSNQYKFPYAVKSLLLHIACLL